MCSRMKQKINISFEGTAATRPFRLDETSFENRAACGERVKFRRWGLRVRVCDGLSRFPCVCLPVTVLII